MLANQQSYEQGLEDLKLVCDGYIEALRRRIPCQPIQKHITQKNDRNTDKAIDRVMGLSTKKEFREAQSRVNRDELGNYKIVKPQEIAFVPTTDTWKVLAFAVNTFGEDIVVSPVYEVFCIDVSNLIPEYLAMWLTRKEFDRYARYHSWGSARENFSFEDMCNVEIPIPDIQTQQYIVNIFNAYQLRKEINKQLLAQIKDLCPILIKGSIDEASACLNMAAEYVQSNKEMETRFMGLSRRLKSAYTICFPSGELTDIETAKAQFYLAIRSIIYKQTKGDAPDAEIMNRVVEEMVRNAIACTGIENIVDENKSVDLFSDEFIAELDAVKMPITKFNALLKLLRKAISSYGRTNKVKAQEFDERLRSVVEAYNSRDKLVFTSEVVADFVNDLSDQLLQILKDLQEDKTSFEKLGISFEEKAFYDILVKVRDDHGFPYADEKCLILAKKIKELVDDKAQFADWSTRDDIKNQLNMELTILLYQNGYPPEWDEEVFEKVMEQAENFKKYSDK